MENQTPVSHTSPDSLEIPQTPPDSHIPTAAADPLFLPIQSQNKRKEVGRCAASSSRSFHDHYALESKNGFMIIPGLENASFLNPDPLDFPDADVIVAPVAKFGSVSVRVPGHALATCGIYKLLTCIK